MMHKAWRCIEEMPYYFSRSCPSNFEVTRAEKSMIWIQFKITRPVAVIKSLRFALFGKVTGSLCTLIKWYAVNGWKVCCKDNKFIHYIDVIMSTMASQITILTIVCSTVYSGVGQSSASLAFVRGIHRWPVHLRILNDQMIDHFLNFYYD